MNGSSLLDYIHYLILEHLFAFGMFILNLVCQIYQKDDENLNFEMKNYYHQLLFTSR